MIPTRTVQREMNQRIFRVVMYRDTYATKVKSIIASFFFFLNRKFFLSLFNPLLDLLIWWMPKHIPQIDPSPDNIIICWLKGAWPKFRVYCAPTKTSTTGPFGNDLQADRSLTRSDYGRLQNQVSTARRICTLRHPCVYLCFIPMYNFAYTNNLTLVIYVTDLHLLHKHIKK